MIFSPKGLLWKTRPTWTNQSTDAQVDWTDHRKVNENVKKHNNFRQIRFKI